MAGIGFELKKLFSEKSLFYRGRAYAASTIVIAGPLLLCVLIITASQLFLRYIEAPFTERELFLGAVQYSFIFSQLAAGGFVLLLARYLSDRIYSREENSILSSLYGVMITVLIAGGMTGMIFYSFSPLPLLFKFFAYMLFMQLMIIWIQTIYISALKEYRKIVYGFLTGVIVSILAIFTGYQLFDMTSAVDLLVTLNAGFFTILFLFFIEIKKRFPVNNGKYFEFLSYAARYPVLILIGFLYTLGLFGHNFIVWMSSAGITVAGTYRMAPLYDVPVFYAYLTILPAMIVFVVSLETAFYPHYQRFYKVVLGSSTLKEIRHAQDRMFGILSREITFVMEFQLFFTISALVFGGKILPITRSQVDIFNIVTVGGYFFITMFILMLVLLYFDDRKGAAAAMGSYTAGLLIITPFTVAFDNFGLSCFIAGVIGLAVALLRLQHISKTFGYYTFCSQPVMMKKHKEKVEGIVSRLNSLNGAGSDYETKK
ncbi:hypothetical protein KP77_32410 [Jeotgalibacillus alimentarius]|uniref:Transmembrane protein n=1 Tax=Jeotgalibacillus alimentarius TaxID=135826 RepID=A0A0C2QZR8_9BACL|nr:exopolysaccharide Pel transporter PelG [Jeotgalibacillus alimentarius]KIL43535.1 hypothetical protein KP77_32410 [Jeotgalibacillus alimentarius]